jgi:hypothetical protein
LELPDHLFAACTGCLANAALATDDPRLFRVHLRWRDDAAAQAVLPRTSLPSLIDHPFDAERARAVA